MNLVDRVSPRRLKDLALEFLEIPSPTGSERAFSEHYAECLRKLGLDAKLDEEFPNSPSVVARLQGKAGGPTLQFDGHTDTVPFEHIPPRYEGGCIYGRGAADMKSSLAAMAEAARILRESSLPSSGGIIVTAHGLHEAPNGYNETLDGLLARGIHGDACVVGELGERMLIIAGKGMCIFRVTVSRAGEVLHEAVAPPDTPNSIMIGHGILDALMGKARELSSRRDEYLGSESIFVGIFRGGDFYNRVPVRCQIEGTWRHLPGRSLEDVKKELEELLTPFRRSPTSVQLEVTRVGDPFKLDPSERIVSCLRRAYASVTGQEMPLGGTSVIGNLPWFIKAGVPGVYHGVNSTTAHSSLEFVKLDDVVRAAKVYLQTAVNFLETEDQG